MDDKDKKDERVYINTFTIVSNPTIKWSEAKERAHTFHISDAPPTFMDWLWHQLPIKDRSSNEDNHQ